MVFLCSTGYMDGEIKWWKEEYKKYYFDFFIANNPEPWTEDQVNNMVEAGLESYFDDSDAGEWECHTPKEAFDEDLSNWNE